MKEGWKSYKLEELCLKIVDCEHKTAPLSENGYPSIRTPNVGKGVLLLMNVNRVSEETYKLWTKREVPKHPDLIFAREAPLGNIAIIPKGLDVCLGQRTVLLRPNEDIVEPRFLCYRILSQDIQNDMHSRGGGSTVSHLNVKEIKNLKISLPPLETQKKIASILSGYDDLIENNLKRIKILEEMAQQTYEEWFVRMRFPGHESATINPETGLPEGWEKVKLGEMITLNYGKALKQDIRVEGPYNVYGSSGIVGTHEKFIVEGPSVIVGRKGNVGSVYYEPKPFYPIDTVYYVSSKYSLFYLFYTIKNLTFVNNDAAVPGLNREAAYAKIVMKPNVELMELFQEYSNATYNLIFNLQNQNQRLREARDILLPRLMMGMVEV